jgi:[amino group carrier protein]-L-2-aminoadipate 6-kinase
MLVVKIGGSVTNPDNVLREIAELDEPVVIVHGASRELDDLSHRLGSPPRIVESGRGDSTRYTDSETMDHFLMAYAGKVNKRIVERLRQLGVNAIGLTGMDGGIVRGRRRSDLRITENGRTKVLHDNHVGTIQRVDPTLLTLLIESGYTPVLTPPIAGEDGTALNVDGDRMAAEIAVALEARALVILSDRPGVLQDVSVSTSTIADVEPDDVEAIVETAGGRMRTKIRAASRAQTRGVGAVLSDGRVERPIASALGGQGTRFR